jgi:hypothetical protein
VVGERGNEKANIRYERAGRGRYTHAVVHVLFHSKVFNVFCTSHHFISVITHDLSFLYFTAASALLPSSYVSILLSPSSYSNSIADHQPCLQSHSLSTLPVPVHMRGSRWSQEVYARFQKDWPRACGICEWVWTEMLIRMPELAQFVDVYAVRYSWTVNVAVEIAVLALISCPSPSPPSFSQS